MALCSRRLPPCTTPAIPGSAENTLPSPGLSCMKLVRNLPEIFAKIFPSQVVFRSSFFRSCLKMNGDFRLCREVNLQKTGGKIIVTSIVCAWTAKPQRLSQSIRSDAVTRSRRRARWPLTKKSKNGRTMRCLAPALQSSSATAFPSLPGRGPLFGRPATPCAPQDIPRRRAGPRTHGPYRQRTIRRSTVTGRSLNQCADFFGISPPLQGAVGTLLVTGRIRGLGSTHGRDTSL